MHSAIKVLLNNGSSLTDSFILTVENVIKDKASLLVRNFLLLSPEGIQLRKYITSSLKFFALNELDSYVNAKVEKHSTKIFGTIVCDSDQRRSEVLAYGKELFDFLKNEFACNITTFQKDASLNAILDNTIDIVFVFTAEFDAR